MNQPVTVNTHWQHKTTAAEVIVSRVTIGEVSYIAADKSYSGCVPQQHFLQYFQPVPERKKPPDRVKFTPAAQNTGVNKKK